MAKRVKEPTLRGVRRTVGGDTKLTIIGEEGGALVSRSNVVMVFVGSRDYVGCSMARVDLNRSETRALRDALTRILGDG